jgi:hypothetical protein
MAGFVFNTSAHQLQNGSLSWVGAVVKARLSRTSEVINRDADTMSGIGLPATDVLVEPRTGPVRNDILDRIEYTSTGVSFPVVAAGAEINKAVVFAFGTTDADSTPIVVVEFAPVDPSGGGIVVNVPDVGMFFTQQ